MLFRAQAAVNNGTAISGISTEPTESGECAVLVQDGQLAVSTLAFTLRMQSDSASQQPAITRRRCAAFLSARARLLDAFSAAHGTDGFYGAMCPPAPHQWDDLLSASGRDR